MHCNIYYLDGWYNYEIYYIIFLKVCLTMLILKVFLVKIYDLFDYISLNLFLKIIFYF